MRIALLHISPLLGNIEHNRRLIETAVVSAAGLGAEWIVTPELCLTGYDFTPHLGTDWIEPQPDAWMSGLCGLVARLGVTLFLSHAEKNAATGKRHNTVFAIGPNGSILGTHRKQTAIPGVEDWSTPGDGATPIAIPRPTLKAGILVCADAYSPRTAQALKERGAQILISCAAWGPDPHGPGTSWEDRSRETGLPLFVCNRTGADQVLDFQKAESVVVSGGQRLVTFSSPDSSILLVEFEQATSTLVWHASCAVAAPAARATVEKIR